MNAKPQEWIWRFFPLRSAQEEVSSKTRDFGRGGEFREVVREESHCDGLADTRVDGAGN